MRAAPHISSDGSTMAKQRLAGRQNFRPLTHALAMKILMPLLSEMPAVTMKNKMVCHLVNGCPCCILRPATHNVSSNMNIEKQKWSGTLTETMT